MDFSMRVKWADLGFYCSLLRKSVWMEIRCKAQRTAISVVEKSNEEGCKLTNERKINPTSGEIRSWASHSVWQEDVNSNENCKKKAWISGLRDRRWDEALNKEEENICRRTFVGRRKEFGFRHSEFEKTIKTYRNVYKPTICPGYVNLRTDF